VENISSEELQLVEKGAQYLKELKNKFVNGTVDSEPSVSEPSVVGELVAEPILMQIPMLRRAVFESD